MLFWGSAGKQIDLGKADERKCETCGQTRLFRATLIYRYIHLYWIFKCVTKKSYFVVCEGCGNGPEVDSAQLLPTMEKSPIPAFDRYGLALLGVVVAAGVGFAIASAPPAVGRDADGTITTEGRIDAFQIELGDCFNDEDLFSSGDETIEVMEVAGTPCGEPHDNEVYAVIDMDLPDFPDDMADVAGASCVERFEAFVGRSYIESSLDIVPIYPTRESWTNFGDREVICALFAMNLQKLEGSVQGTGL
jgi:hypothetical protein